MIKMEKRKETDRLIVLRGMINHNLQASTESGNKVNEKYVLSHRKKKPCFDVNAHKHILECVRPGNSKLPPTLPQAAMGEI